VLLAYTKIVLADELIRTDLPDDPFLRNDLFSYFPTNMRQTYRDWMESHPLRREIIVTQVVNDLVNGAGITFFHRLSEETGASAEELVRANFVAREIFGSRRFVDAVYRLDNEITSPTQIEMRIVMRTLVERATRWLINNRRAPMDSAATVQFFQDTAEKLLGAMPELLSGRELGAFERRRSRFVDAGVPEDLATRASVLPPAYAILTIVETARRDEVDPLEVCRLHFALGDRLGLSALVDRILALPRDDRWQTMARAALRDDLHTVHAQLTAQVLGATDPDQPVPVRIADWEDRDTVVVSRSVGTLEEICSDEHADLARLSVGLRVVRTLLSGP
jgi:glutamate dehydrogenase